MNWIKIPGTNEEISPELETKNDKPLNLDWFEATKYAEERGMRLPTFAELADLTRQEFQSEWTSECPLNNKIMRIVRGGAWVDDRDLAACSYRFIVHPHYRNFDIGFRLVRKISETGLNISKTKLTFEHCDKSNLEIPITSTHFEVKTVNRDIFVGSYLVPIYGKLTLEAI